MPTYTTVDQSHARLHHSRWSIGVTGRPRPKRSNSRSFFMHLTTMTRNGWFSFSTARVDSIAWGNTVLQAIGHSWPR